MLNFPIRTLNNIKKYLRKQQKEVEKNLKDVTADDPAKPPELAESSEPGTDSYIADTHTKSVVLEKELRNIDTSIKAALIRIKKGTYGKCENCGKSIGIKRLLAMPTANYCLICSQKKTSKK